MKKSRLWMSAWNYLIENIISSIGYVACSIYSSIGRLLRFNVS